MIDYKNAEVEPVSYINQRLQYELCLPSVSQPEVEMQSITLLGNNITTSQTIVAIVIYRPPHSNYAQTYNTIKNYIYKLYI